MREPTLSPPGVVLLKFVADGAAAVTRVILELLDRSDPAIEGFLSVVEAQHLRQRRLRAVERLAHRLRAIILAPAQISASFDRPLGR